MSKTYRINGDTQELIHEKRINLIIKTKEDIKESDILHALINKHIHNITIEDIENFKEDKIFKKTDKG